MDELQKNQLAFLEEGIAHFNSNNRAVLATGCVYSPIEGISQGCFIGRHLPAALSDHLDGHGSGVSSDYVFKELPHNLTELGQWFLRDCQVLHDYPELWDENGLSKKGRDEVQIIKEKFNLI